MARSKWDELLSTSATPSTSRNDAVQQLVQIVSAGSGGSGGSGSVSGVLGSVPQGSSGEFTEQISSLVTQMGSLASIQQTLAGATQDNTQALSQNTASKSGSSSSVGSVASTVLGGSILSPILGGLMDLFGVGDGGQAAVAASPFMLPAPVQYQGGTSSPGQVMPTSYAESGQPRAQAAAATPQVNIQVNAMDSQSFMDHSDEIATAVRSALLNSHPLADVISDL